MGNTAKGIGIGIAIGAALGLVLGYLTAPRSGEESRHWIKDKTGQIKDKTVQIKDKTTSIIRRGKNGEVEEEMERVEA